MVLMFFVFGEWQSQQAGGIADVCSWKGEHKTDFDVPHVIFAVDSLSQH